MYFTFEKMQNIEQDIKAKSLLLGAVSVVYLAIAAIAVTVASQIAILIAFGSSITGAVCLCSSIYAFNNTEKIAPTWKIYKWVNPYQNVVYAAARTIIKVDIPS